MLHFLKYICDLTQKLEHDSGNSKSGFDFIPVRSYQRRLAMSFKATLQIFELLIGQVNQLGF